MGKTLGELKEELRREQIKEESRKEIDKIGLERRKLKKEIRDLKYKKAISFGEGLKKGAIALSKKMKSKPIKIKNTKPINQQNKLEKQESSMLDFINSM